MKRLSFFLGAVLLGSALAQQPPGDEELTPLQRIERLERVFSQRTLQDSPTLSSASLENRLSSLESRVQRLEQQALRSGAGGGTDRVLEGRVRELEREVSRLRR